MASSCGSNGCRAVGGCIILHKFCYKYESRTDSYTRPDILKSINCFVLCYTAARLHIAAHTRACTFSMYALAYKHILTPQQQHAKSKGDVLMAELWTRSTTCHKLAATSSNFTFMSPCIVTNLFLIKPTDVLISQIYFVKKLYMFRAVPLPIIRSFPLYIRHWYMSCRFDDSFRKEAHAPARKLSSTCMTYTSAECTVENS
jgi:hypothetical protein